MRRGIGVVLAVIAVVSVIALGIGALNGGPGHGAQHTLVDGGDGAEVVHVIGPGYGHRGGFFPGFLLFPLGFILVLMLLKAAFTRGHTGHGHAEHGGPGSGPWGGHAPPMFDEWHRRQHEATDQAPPPSDGG